VDVIFDDDDAGEWRMVALPDGAQAASCRPPGHHCKYSGEVKAGCRVDELLCGLQAQRKGVHWREKRSWRKLVPLLIDQENKAASER